MINTIGKYVAWLRWWLLFVLIVLGTAALCLSGVLQRVSSADITKISFLIYVVFGYFSIRTGIDTHSLCVGRGLKDITRRSETALFAANALLTLGMIGTVVGFIYMLTSCFVDVVPGSIDNMRGLLTKMSIGMGTALYTTAAGLICSLLLRLQLFNLDYYMKNGK